MAGEYESGGKMVGAASLCAHQSAGNADEETVTRAFARSDISRRGGVRDLAANAHHQAETAGRDNGADEVSKVVAEVAV